MPGKQGADVAWKKHPIMAGLEMETAEWALREKPGPGEPPVATAAAASVAPDMDWRSNGVLWGVVFRRYVPRNPLEMRTIENQATGRTMEIAPPSIIPERKLGGRIPVQGDDLAGAMKEAKRLCEETVRAGRWAQSTSG